MTLGELYAVFYRKPDTCEPSKMYVFNDEGSADSWVLDTYSGEENRDYELLMVIQSDFNLEITVTEEIRNAEVDQFCAVAPDTIVVVIKRHLKNDR